MHSSDYTNIQRVLVMKWSAMGDLAMASAAFEDIAKALPGCQIDLDTLPPWDKLYRGDPRFNHIHCFNLRKGGWRESLRWLAAMRNANYDLVIDLQTTDRSRSLIALLGLSGKPIRWRAGNKSAYPYNLAPTLTGIEPRHALNIAHDTLRAANIPPAATYPHLHIDPPTRSSATKLLAAAGLNGKQFAMFLPGCQAAGYLKRWGIKNYVDLATQLMAAGIERVAILGGPDEMDDCAAIADACGEAAINLCGQTELLHVPVIAQSAQIIIANDTGTAHLAAASNSPMIVVCGPTDPRRVLPAGANVRGAQVQLPCINCYRKHCAHHSCMRLLHPTQVMRQVRMLVPALA